MNTQVELDIPPQWDDAAYLAENPDVKEAVGEKRFSSGYQHYVLHGILEGRKYCKRSITQEASPWPWSDTAYLSRNPEVSNELLIHDCTPRQHFEKFGRARELSSGLDEIVKQFARSTTLPTWAADEMLALAEYEPALDFARFDKWTIYNPAAANDVGASLVKIIKELHSHTYDVAFVVPWIRIGGADTLILRHVDELRRTGRSVLVITCEIAASEWAGRLSADVEIVPFGTIFAECDEVSRCRLFFYLIATLGVKDVHIINGSVGWQTLLRNPAALCSIARVWLSVYCYDYTEFGEPVGYARGLRNVARHVTGIFTDNETFRESLIREIGIAESKVYSIPSPVNVIPTWRPDVALHTNKVLWASRLDRQKQPEILAEIARRLPGLEFHVHGGSVVGGAPGIHEILSGERNIVLHGEFQSTGAILRSGYRCFLYTSLWDGLPITLLEVMAAGLLAVTSGVGGIADTLGPERCLLVSDPKSVDQYVEKLTWVFQNPKEAEMLRIAGQEYVQSNHSAVNFCEALIACGYLQGPSEGSKGAAVG